MSVCESLKNVSSQSTVSESLPSDSSSAKNLGRNKKLGPCLCFGHFCLGVVFSLLAPFFPRVAQSKDLTPLQYSIIFGIYQFGIFIISPIIGHYLSKKSRDKNVHDKNSERFKIERQKLKNFIVWSLIITALCNTLFGLVGSSNLTGWPYFWISVILRVLESAGGAGFLTASGATIMTFFPENVSGLYGTTETFGGIGMMTGPLVGGVLFEVGGFKYPFIFSSCLCLISSGLFQLCIPKESDGDCHEEKRSLESAVVQEEDSSRELYEEKEKRNGGIVSMVSNGKIALNLAITMTALMNLGFNEATLEQHLRDHVSWFRPSIVGSIFVVTSVFIVISNSFFGWLLDSCHHHNHHSSSSSSSSFSSILCNGQIFTLIGYILTLISLITIGPIYPITFQANIFLILLAQSLLGISFSIHLISSFTLSFQEALKSGFPDDLSTSASISSLFQSACALGATVGPLIGGILTDNERVPFLAIGYQKSLLFMASIQVLMVIVIAINLCKS